MQLEVIVPKWDLRWLVRIRLKYMLLTSASMIHDERLRGSFSRFRGHARPRSGLRLGSRLLSNASLRSCDEISRESHKPQIRSTWSPRLLRPHLAGVLFKQNFSAEIGCFSCLTRRLGYILRIQHKSGSSQSISEFWHHFFNMVIKRDIKYTLCIRRSLKVAFLKNCDVPSANSRY